jgi:hypothetical protein
MNEQKWEENRNIYVYVYVYKIWMQIASGKENNL